MHARRLFLLLCVAAPLAAQTSLPGNDPKAPYHQANLPVEDRVHDLLGRMTIEEKARQLDMFAGAPGLIDKAKDKTHAAPDASFRIDEAEKLFGNLGAGSIHDLYPRAELANGMQKWVIDHSRLGIPALFIEEGLHDRLNVQ